MQLNEKLETEQTRRQVAIMDEKGVGGYFMHARGGIMTEYILVHFGLVD